MSSKEQAHGADKTSAKRPPAKPTSEAPEISTLKQIPPASILQQAGAEPHRVTPEHVLQLQRTIGNRAVGQFLSEMAPKPPPAPQAKPDTGLPNSLKAGIENLSGLAMDDVQVHYNSDKPAEMRALAFTEGKDIHVARGQEQHLPHEAWHVVQQKQGKVTPSLRLRGNRINVDSGLEAEAEAMGARASQPSVAGRLPSPAQAAYSGQQLGQPAQAVQRNAPGMPARQFRCGSKGKAKQPTLTDLTTTMTQKAREFKKDETTITPEIMQQVWENEAPDPTTDILFEKYGLDVASELPYERSGQTFTAMVPPSITQDLKGNNGAKLDTLFGRINQYNFVYTGSSNTPEVGFANKSGDCKTLANMFKLAAEAAGITGVSVDGEERHRLVPAAAAHGRTETSNEMSGQYWWFENHYWCTYKGTKYDMLFMEKGGAIPPTYLRNEGADLKYKECGYSLFAGGRAFITKSELQAKLGEDTDKQGIAFNSEDELKLYVDSK